MNQPQEADDRALFDMADALLTVREVRWYCPYCEQEMAKEYSWCCGEQHARPMPDGWED